MPFHATALCRIRVGGSNTNGGGFDPAVSGAGTDYTDQDSPQLTLTDLATSGAGSTTLTSATGGFTAAMVGNYIQITSGTNFQTGYYRVDAYTDTNTVTVHTTPTSGGAGSGGNGKLGGAWANFTNISDGSFGSYNPSVTSPIVNGNKIYIRGAGSELPSSADYTNTNWIGLKAVGTIAAGRVELIGYNGRPRISVSSSGFMSTASTAFVTVKHIYFAFSGSATTDGLIVGSSAFSNHATFIDCVIDQAGYDTLGISGSAINCSFINSGGKTAGTAGRVAIYARGNYHTSVMGCVIRDWRAGGIYTSIDSGGSIHDNIVSRCKGVGIESNATGGDSGMANSIIGNTVIGCSSDSIKISNANAVARTIIKDNILHDSGGYHINISAGTLAVNDRLLMSFCTNNFLRTSTSGNYNGFTGGNDTQLTADALTNPTSDDYTPNNTSGGGAVVRSASSQFATGGDISNYRDGGAVQHQDSGGGGPVAQVRVIQNIGTY